MTDAASAARAHRPTGRRALAALLSGRGVLGALSAVHADLGNVFDLPLPGFPAVVVAGPEAARFVLVDGPGDLRWRMESDPVARLLRHGLLVEDGAAHDAPPRCRRCTGAWSSARRSSWGRPPTR